MDGATLCAERDFYLVRKRPKKLPAGRDCRIWRALCRSNNCIYLLSQFNIGISQFNIGINQFYGFLWKEFTVEAKVLSGRNEEGFQ